MMDSWPCQMVAVYRIIGYLHGNVFFNAGIRMKHPGGSLSTITRDLATWGVEEGRSDRSKRNILNMFD